MMPPPSRYGSGGGDRQEALRSDSARYTGALLTLVSAIMGYQVTRSDRRGAVLTGVSRLAAVSG